MATLLAAETIEAIRFVYGLQPEPMPGFQLAGGTAFTSPDDGHGGNGLDGHLNGPIDDIQLRSWGIQLVDGRMPGFAAIVGAAKSNEVAVKIVRELQRRNILCLPVRQRQRAQHHPPAAAKKASSWVTIPTPCPLAPTPSAPSTPWALPPARR